MIVTASSCTSALAAVLIALDARRTVLFPAFTFPATPASIIMAGATPAALDVDEDQWTVSPENLERGLRQEDCDAVVLVAPFGMAQDFRSHFELCDQYGVPVIVDNAAGLGGPRNPLANENVFEVYSLHATKVFAIGEGGAIRARETQHGRLHRALNFGLQSGAPTEGAWGINGKLPEVMAAIGLAVLENLDEALEKRRAMVESYIQIFSDSSSIKFPLDVSRAPWQTFPVLFPEPEESETFVREVNHHGVEVRRYYRPSLDTWPRVKKLQECPVARRLGESMVCLPVYSDLSSSEAPDLFSAVEASLVAARS